MRVGSSQPASDRASSAAQLGQFFSNVFALGQRLGEDWPEIDGQTTITEFDLSTSNGTLIPLNVVPQVVPAGRLEEMRFNLFAKSLDRLAPARLTSL